MAMANSLIGDDTLFFTDPDRHIPFSPSDGIDVRAGAGFSTGGAANWLAAILFLALLTIVLIRIAGLQAMIAVGQR